MCVADVSSKGHLLGEDRGGFMVDLWWIQSTKIKDFTTKHWDYLMNGLASGTNYCKVWIFASNDWIFPQFPLDFVGVLNLQHISLYPFDLF